MRNFDKSIKIVSFSSVTVPNECRRYVPLVSCELSEIPLEKIKVSKLVEFEKVGWVTKSYEETSGEPRLQKGTSLDYGRSWDGCQTKPPLLFSAPFKGLADYYLWSLRTPFE